MRAAMAEVFTPQFDDDVVIQHIRDRRVGNVLFHNFLNTIVAGFGFRRRGLREDELAVDLRELLVIHQLAVRTSIDDVVFLAEINDSLLLGGGLSAQFFKRSCNQTCSPRLFVFGIELVIDIGFRDRIRDLRGFLGVDRLNIDLHHIALADPVDQPLAGEG